MDNKIKHLEMIQNIINRMATNSFLVKGWCVTLVAALFALSSGSGNLRFTILAYFPTIMFWTLDGYYLWQERLFRGLYDYVREKEEEKVDFSMNIFPVLSKTSSWLATVFSKTLLVFYGTLALAVLITVIVAR